MCREECGCQAVPIVSPRRPDLGSDGSSHELQSSVSFHWEHLRAEWKLPGRCFASRYPPQHAPRQRVSGSFGQSGKRIWICLRLCCWGCAQRTGTTRALCPHHRLIPKYRFFFRNYESGSCFSELQRARAQCWVTPHFGILTLTQDQVTSPPCLEAYQ